MNAKKNAAAKAVEVIEDGMIVGLGSGSTASYAVEIIGERVRQGLQIKAIASSKKTEMLAREVGITILDDRTVSSPDIALDGADEVDTIGNLIKGGGGSLLREKIIAFASKRFYVMVDQSKLVNSLGKLKLPVEIIPFGAGLTLHHIILLGGHPVLRQSEGKAFVSDNGNLIADCSFGEITDPASLDVKLKMIPGVVETGLFLSKIVTGIFAGFEDRETKLILLNP